MILNKSYQSVLLWFAILTLTIDFAQWHEVFYGHDFRAWQPILFLMFGLLILWKNIKIHKVIFLLFMILSFHIVVCFIMGDNSISFSLIQLVLFTIGITTTYSFARKLGPYEIFKVYLIAAQVVSISIVVEQVIYQIYPDVGFSFWYSNIPIYDEIGFMLRGHGILREPSQASLVLPPAIFLALWYRMKKNLVLYSIADVFTLSIFTYFGTALVLLAYGYMKSKKRLVIIILILGAAIPLLYLLPVVSERVDSLIKIKSSVEHYNTLDAKTIYEELGGSVGALFVNASVAASAFYETYGLGVGLGNFGLAFDQYLDIRGITSEAARESLFLFHSVDTSGSLIIRLIAELGILGLTIIIIMFYVFLISLSRIKLSIDSQLVGLHDLRMAYAVCFIFAVSTILIYIIRKDGYFNIYLLMPLGIALSFPPKLLGKRKYKK